MNRNSVKKKAACAAAAVLALSMTVSTPISILAEDNTASTATALTNLETEGKQTPIGIDTQNPVFSWQRISDVTGAAQKSYQIVVTKADGTQVWDSGKVESDVSLDIAYEGEALEPCTIYNWTLTVEDNAGNTITSDSTFETSKLSTELDAWNGAKWIGADELSLNAASTTLFDITTKVQIPEGSNKASVIFGANDFRYNNKLYNLYQLEGENYFRVELDVTNAGLLEKSEFAFDVLGSHINTGVLMLGQEGEITSASLAACNKIVDFYETKEFMQFARRMYRWNQAGFFHNVPGEEVENASKSKLDVTFIPTREAIRTTDASQNVLWSIPATSEKPEKVIEFLNLLYTDSTASNLLQRGIEGESYVVVEENKNLFYISHETFLSVKLILLYNEEDERKIRKR